MCSITARCIVGLGAAIVRSPFCQNSTNSQQNSCKTFQNLPHFCPMTAEERQKRIEDHLHKVEFASLEELAQKVGASVSTVRRDLTLLEVTGSLKRTHGGARLLAPPTDEFTFSARDTHQLTEKDSI